MSLFLNQIYHLLTSSPGNLLYHIVLVFSIAGALQGAIHLLLSSQFPQARRTVLGLGVLLGLQIILIVVSGLTWQGPLGSQTVLPPLDRVVTLLGLVWIIWLWAFPEPSRRADAATVLLHLVALIGFGLTLAFWIPGSLASFNTSIFETIWQALSLVVALLGILVLTVRKPNGWGNGLAMLLLALIGHLASLFFIAKGAYPGYVRLTQLALFPILLTLVQRFSSPVSKRPPAGKTVKSTNEPVVERRRYSTDPKTFHALLSLAAEAEADKIPAVLTRGIAQAMLADLCFLITLTEEKNLLITCGYDLIREEDLDGTAVIKDSIPLLANAILHGRPLRLPTSSTSSDLKALGEILGLSNSGNLLSVPISSPEREPLGGILILSPYSNRLWSADDQAYLSNVSPLFVPILERGRRLSVVEAERDQARQVALSLQEQAANGKKKYEDAAKEMDELHEKISQAQLQGENIAVLVTMQEESQKTIDSLKAEIEHLRKAKEAVGVSDYPGQLETEPGPELKEFEPMPNTMEDTSTRDLEQRSAAAINNEQVEVITSISQELRQPMSSIVGYTDLLLGDSVGVLGALQRKFIERIKASTERIGSLVDDLIQITTLETGRMQFKPELTDLNLIIDNAMAYTSTQIREKNITMRLDIPDTSPHILTDRDAFQQILIHLLQNATAATQAEGTITLRVQMQHEAEQYFISIQVTDSGGGIASEDLPRVFARRYRAEHSLIQGLGDTGVGLSIAKAIVEAQGGRIWVETEVGDGSTFSVLLPVLYDPELED